MNILINKIHFPVTVLGYGTRLGIWLQGCSIHCKACVSQDTWAFDDSFKININHLMQSIQTLIQYQSFDGITISGGEPFDQPEALLNLIIQLKTLSNVPFDILVYSGYSFRHLQKHYQEILNQIDALISEPFNHKQPATLIYRGSANQRLNLLSELGRQRYESTQFSTFESQKKFQLVVDEQSIWFIGIPDQQTMQKLEILSKQQGLDLSDQNSWKT